MGRLGRAKDEAGVAMANPGRRRVRGWAAQQLFAAFLLAETATRRIYRFLADAKTDRNGDLCVERRLMPDKSHGDGPAGGTTGSLPGTPPVIEDDPATPVEPRLVRAPWTAGASRRHLMS